MIDEKAHSEVRLFPVLSENSREGRAIASFLSTLIRSKPFARGMIEPLGPRIGKSTKLTAWTEYRIETKKNGELRPDALLEVKSRSKVWTAFIEAKVHAAKLDPNQINAYLSLAKEKEVSAVITISNDFVALPTHHPLIAIKPPKGVGLYHWSWASILSQGILVDSEDEEFGWMVEELVHFLSHKSAGVRRFDAMGPEWTSLVREIVAGGIPNANSDKISAVVGSWHQEVRDLALKLSERIGEPVRIGMEKAHRVDQVKRLADDGKLLANEKKLEAQYLIRDAASPLRVEANCLSKSISVAMVMKPPGDRKTSKACVSWLLRQLKSSDPSDLHLRIRWPRRKATSQAPLQSVQEDASCIIDSDRSAIIPHTLEILLIKDIGRKFEGQRTFISELEDCVPKFYEEVGQRLKVWRPKAPQIIFEVSEDEEDRPAIGNADDRAQIGDES